MGGNTDTWIVAYRDEGSLRPGPTGEGIAEAWAFETEEEARAFVQEFMIERRGLNVRVDIVPLRIA